MPELKRTDLMSERDRLLDTLAKINLLTTAHVRQLLMGKPLDVLAYRMQLEKELAPHLVAQETGR